MLHKVRKRLLAMLQDADLLAISADIGALYCQTQKFHHLTQLIRESLAVLGDAGGHKALLERILNAASRELDETQIISPGDTGSPDIRSYATGDVGVGDCSERRRHTLPPCTCKIDPPPHQHQRRHHRR